MNSHTSIMLIEDDMIDIMTVKRTLKDLFVTSPLIVKNNGEEALDYLSNPDTDKPDLILLDLNMPKMNGFEFLEIAGKEPRLRNIPVIVLTTSEAEHDCTRSLELGATAYMVKPVSYTEFVESMRNYLNRMDINFWKKR